MKTSLLSVLAVQLAVWSAPSAQAAVDLNGTTQYLATADTARLQFGTGDFTVCGWFYAETTHYGSNFAGVVSKDINGFEVIIYQNNLYGYVGGASNNVVGSTTLSTGTWYHLAFRRSGTSIQLFLNGATEGSAATNSASASASTRSLVFGNSNRVGDLTRFFDGRIAEWALWNVALDNAQIASLAAGLSPLRMRLSSCAGYFTFVGNVLGGDLTSSASITFAGSPPAADHPRIYR